MKPVPIDDNVNHLLDRASEIGTKNISVSTGTALSFTVDIKSVTITPSAPVTFAGTTTGYSDAVQHSTPWTIPIAVPANTTIGTLAAVTGTVPCIIEIMR